MYTLPEVGPIVSAALAEDLGVSPDLFLGRVATGQDVLTRDVTGASVIGEDAAFSGAIVAREPGVVCGLPAVAKVYDALSSAAGLFEPVDVFPLVAEGSRVVAGTAVAEVSGLARVVLAGERTALDFVMVLSGIATETARWVEAASGRVAVCDTRKTVPGLRALSKYAVAVGGGTNHRLGLYDMVLIKDNHLRHMTVTEAISRARAANPELLIEAEADTIKQAVEAVSAGADMVLLDNMDDAALADAVAACREAEKDRGRPVLIEVSGGVDFGRLQVLAQAGADRISSSALTLAQPVDFGLDERAG